MPMAFGQEEALGAQKISLTSDNTAYQEGDVITITGKIEKVIPGMPVTLQIFCEKNLCHFVLSIWCIIDCKYICENAVHIRPMRNDGFIPLHLAAHRGQMKVTKLLIENDRDNLQADILWILCFVKMSLCGERRLYLSCSANADRTLSQSTRSGLISADLTLLVS